VRRRGAPFGELHIIPERPVEVSASGSAESLPARRVSAAPPDGCGSDLRGPLRRTVSDARRRW